MQTGAPNVLNVFAMAFTLSEAPAAAAPVFEQRGSRPTPVPWAYLPGDFAENFQAARLKVLS
ncbi:hypothetical protein ACXJJ3_20660 [Kribbella sp. WER1]